MTLRAIFIGKPLHWVLWATIVPVLFAMGSGYLHVRHFNVFFAVVSSLGAAAVLWVLFTTRRGETITREPYDEGDWQQTGIDE